MEFRCERDVLADVLKGAARAANRKGGSRPVLACVHLTVEGDQLTVEGSDLEISVAVTTVVAGTADGEAAIPAKLLVDVVASLPPGAVTVVVDADQATVTAGRSSFVLRGADPADYPRLAWPDTTSSATVPAKAFVAAVNRVTPAASDDQSRPILCGVLLERRDGHLRLVATDSYRLTFEDLPHPDVLGGADRALVPADALETLARVATRADQVSVRLDDRTVTFAVGGELRVSARLIEGEFPNYAGLIPKAHAGTLTANREELADRVKQAAVLARESTPVRFEFGPADNLLSAVTQDVGTARVGFDAGYDGPEMTVGFNPHYLLDALEACPGDTVQIRVTDGRQPAVIVSPGADEFLALLMPVRVS